MIKSYTAHVSYDIGVSRIIPCDVNTFYQFVWIRIENWIENCAFGHDVIKSTL